MTEPEVEMRPRVERMLVETVGEDWRGRVDVTRHGNLPSVFPVTELATASIAAAGVATRDLFEAVGLPAPHVVVDRRLASMWFGSSVRPQGWEPPPPWDAIAGDYRASDGWIRLHTNAPSHRAAALSVLGVPADRERVSAAVAQWDATDLEHAVVAAGGCAAAMRTTAQWDASMPGRSVAAEPLVKVDAIPAGADYERKFWGGISDPARPLRGLRVLDLTRVLAGPVATRFLAQLGAEVLRIDPPEWDEPGITPDVMLGKRSARMDLRDPVVRGSLLRLLSQADVLIHGYRPGALEGLGLGAAVREQARPGLVEVQLVAYGWSGPWAGRRGFDSLVQMSTGIAAAGMHALERDRPTPLPVQALDHATGYLMAAAALHGLAARHNTGAGSRASLSLARTATLLTTHKPLAPVEPPMRVEDVGDLAPDFEQTSWGAARRLRAPVTIDGVRLQAEIPARSLGSDSAAWL